MTFVRQEIDTDGKGKRDEDQDHILEAKTGGETETNRLPNK
jgi:hypothetical protein